MVSAVVSHLASFFPSTIPSLDTVKNSLGGLIGKTSEIGLKVLKETAPHILQGAIYHYNMNANFLIGFHSFLLSLIKDPLTQDADFFYFCQHLLYYLNSSSGIVKHSLASQVFFDTFYSLGRMSQSAETIKAGWRVLRNSGMDLSGVVLCAFGGAMLYSSCEYGKKLIKGLQIAKSMEPDQLKFVIKNNTIAYLGCEKKGTAVIIDGCSSKWGYLQDEHQDLVAKSIYQHYDTRTYEVENDAQFSKALLDASQRFGKLIDVLMIKGHTCTKAALLNSNYWFDENSNAIDAIRKYIPAGSQVILAGCNSGTLDMKIGKSLSQRIADKLPGREVVGMAAYYNPNMTTTYHDGKKLNFRAFSVADENGRWFFPKNIATTFLATHPVALPQPVAEPRTETLPDPRTLLLEAAHLKVGAADLMARAGKQEEATRLKAEAAHLKTKAASSMFQPDMAIPLEQREKLTSQPAVEFVKQKELAKPVEKRIVVIEKIKSIARVGLNYEVVLSDDSKWKIKSSFPSKASKWKIGDQIEIARNGAIVSRYQFRFHNATMGNRISVNLISAPDTSRYETLRQMDVHLL